MMQTPPEVVWWPYLQQVTDQRAIIIWTTQTGNNPAVDYGVDGTMTTRITGTTRLLEPLQLQMHRVDLTNLTANTVYSYQILLGDAYLLPDQTFSFRTAPSPGSELPFTFLAWGDFGFGDFPQQRLRNQMALDSFDFIVSTGDNAYPSGTYEEFDTNMFQIYTDIFSNAPLYPSLGNHDYYTDLGAPYLDIFDLPRQAWREADHERYYSFDYGNAHFIVLDSDRPLYESDGAANDDMFDWARHDLAHTTQPWKIAVMHVPAYTGGTRGDEQVVLPKLPPLYEQYGVDLVLSGHDHTYQRTMPIYQGEIDEARGITYIISGAGAMANYPCRPESPEWLASAFCGRTIGIYARISVDGPTMVIEGVNANGEVVDAVTMTKAPGGPIADVTLSGPAEGVVNTTYTFTALVSPPQVTLPLTYTWTAGDMLPVAAVSGIGHTTAYSWTTPGTYDITVAVLNAEQTAISRSHTISITE